MTERDDETSWPDDAPLWWFAVLVAATVVVGLGIGSAIGW
jgi:hypothetical protein